MSDQRAKGLDAEAAAAGAYSSSPCDTVQAVAQRAGTYSSPCDRPQAVAQQLSNAEADYAYSSLSCGTAQAVADAYLSSRCDRTQVVAQQLSNVDQHLPGDRHRSETICVSSDHLPLTATNAAADSVSSDENSGSGKDSSDAVKCAFADHLPSTEPSEAAAPSCVGNPVGFSMADVDAAIARDRQVLERIQSEQEEFERQMERAEAEINRAADMALSQVCSQVECSD